MKSENHKAGQVEQLGDFNSKRRKKPRNPQSFEIAGLHREPINPRRNCLPRQSALGKRREII